MERRFARHLAGFTGAVALVVIGGLSVACGSNATNNPTTTTTTPTTTAAATSVPATAPPLVSPTQNRVSPSGPNSFAPNPNDSPPPAYMPPSTKKNSFTPNPNSGRP
jgi:hypothetical protein